MEFNYSIGRVLLLTFLIVASPSCKNLFSNSLKKEIEENRYVQHLILLTLIITVLTTFGNTLNINNDDNINNIIVGFIIYVFFILLTKLDFAWNVGILIMTTLYFFYENNKLNDINNINNDNLLDKYKKKSLIDKLQKHQKYILGLLFGLTVVGTGIYFFEKKEQIQNGGGDFTMKEFFFN